MSKVVEYVLQLKDQFSHVIDQAEGKTKHLHGVIERTRHVAEHMFETMGIGFAIFKGYEFIKQSKEEVEKLDLAISQIHAGLESTRGVAGLTFDELKAGAEEAAHQFKFTQTQILDMQSILLTFPSVSKKVFGEASQAIFDMSTRLHEDLDSTAIRVGKALQDPIKGVTALRRVGVNFNETQTEMIKRMVQSGHAAQAQAYILKELQTEFAGSAKAAAGADPLFRFNKSMEELKVTIGEVVIELLEALTPALEAIATGFKDTIEWMKEHKSLLQDIAVVVGVAAAAWGIYTLVTSGAAIVSGILTAAVTALNFVLSISPLGWLMIAIAGVISLFVILAHHIKEVRAFLMGLWETIKEFGRIVGDVFMGVGKVIMGVLTLKPSLITEGFEQTLGAISDAGHRLGHAFKTGYDDGAADFDRDHVTSPNSKVVKSGPSKGAYAPPTEASNSPGTKVSGQRINNFNIVIQGGLAPHMTFSVTNIQESMARIKEQVGKALVSSINDAQIIGDH